MSILVGEENRPFDLLDLHRQQPERYPFLLQSSASGARDLLFAFPGDALALDASGGLHGPHARPDGDFLRSLDDWFRAEFTAGAAAEMPCPGGWFVYLGYELAGQVEPVLQLPASAAGLPVAFAVRVPAVIVREHADGTCRIAVEDGRQTLLQQIRQDIGTPGGTGAHPHDAPAVAALHEEDPRRFLESVARIRDYIVEGDVFQVNLSRRWDVQLQQPAAPALLYDRLRLHNPSPFGGLVLWEDYAIVSSSPERLVRVRDGVAETRPIAGTRPRAAALAADRAFSDELLASPKERAEHVMLIDLERNDLGRICRPGSIEVNERMVLESYAHVHHIVSNVRGRLRHGILPGEVLRAMFPGGTITGCPKVRCMEIIAELERQPRGAYTGSMGYLDRCGNMDLNILIRTMVSHGKRLELRAGAGIVADSDAAAELAETRAKARGLLRALGLERA